MNTFFDRGFVEDVNGNYEGAIELYMASVEKKEHCLDAHLNLVGILIEISFEYGVSNDLLQRHIYTDLELSNLYKYLDVLLKRTELQFNSNEAEFWKYYKENFFNGLETSKIREIAEKDDSNLVPYFKMYIDDLVNGKDILYYSKVEKLKHFLREHKTIKNKYIFSLMEGAEKQLSLM